MAKPVKLRRSEIKVRKVLPTRLVAERVHESKKTYRRARVKRLSARE